MANERGSGGYAAPGLILWQGPRFGWINRNFCVNN